MDLRLDLTVHGDVPVLSLQGEVDLATVPRLHDRFVAVSSAHPGQVLVLDLDGVTSIDDAGFGTLLGGLRRLTAYGGDIIAVCTSEALLDQLRQCRLDRVFTVHPDVTSAVRAARAAR